MDQPVCDCQFLRRYHPREPRRPLFGALHRLLGGLEPVGVLGVRVEVVGVHRRLERGDRGQRGLQRRPTDQPEGGASEGD